MLGVKAVRIACSNKTLVHLQSTIDKWLDVGGKETAKFTKYNFWKAPQGHSSLVFVKKGFNRF